MDNANKFPIRHKLYHDVPLCVYSPEIHPAFFITICANRNHYFAQGETQPLLHSAQDILADLVEYHHQHRFHLHLALVMPDHLHLIARFPCAPMKKIIASVKRLLARKHAITWQDGFFDTRLRTDEMRIEKYDYIRMNPVRAKLTSSPETWPYQVSFQ